MDEWHAGWHASLPISDKPLILSSNELLRIPSGEPPVTPPPSEVHPKYVIKVDSVVNLEKSDGNGDDLEWIDDLR